MRLKTKIMLLAMTPLVASAGLIVVAQRQQEELLSQRQAALVRSAYLDAAREELRHFTALALSTVSPLYNTGRDDAAIRQQAMRQLAALDYGSDGYFFLYDFDGVNLMHPRQPELVGRNLLKLRDEYGQFPIQMMRDKARAGGGFVDYSWNKPSTQNPAPKIAYVTPLERWNWWFGTGIYVDDIDQVVAQLDRELQASTNTTMRWIAAIMGGGLLLVFGGGLWLSMHELRVADAKLTRLARQLVESHEVERAYLARELHDGTGQTLVSVKLLTEAALQRLPPENDGQAGARGALALAVERLKDALAEVRGLSHRLRPVMLDTLGLPAALGQLGQEMWGLTETRFTMRVEGPVVDLPEDIKTVLFRVTQEALTNIQKHAGASRVELTLVFSSDGVRLAVQDNGRGFDLEAVRRDPTRGIGLRHLRERLAAIDAQLEITSRPGQTQVLAVVPQAVIERFSAA
jgi:two-component system, NarL family, sensor kinase